MRRHREDYSVVKSLAGNPTRLFVRMDKTESWYDERIKAASSQQERNMWLAEKAERFTKK